MNGVVLRDAAGMTGTKFGRGTGLAGATYLSDSALGACAPPFFHPQKHLR
jgi:aerobic-type carbon monoxide dehydrogenase small subunit (CoxS/CutS family)